MTGHPIGDIFNLLVVAVWVLIAAVVILSGALLWVVFA